MILLRLFSRFVSDYLLGAFFERTEDVLNLAQDFLDFVSICIHNVLNP